MARSNLVVQAAAPTLRQRRGRRPQPEDELLAEIKDTIAGQPTYGYRRIHALLRRQRREEGGAVPVNVKRVYRVMKAHGLLLERHTENGAERRHEGRVAVDHPDTRWCSDGFEIGCDNGERVRIAFTLDCCDREAISWVAMTGGINGGDIRDLMLDSVERRFGLATRLPRPIEWLSDNGSPYTAHKTRALPAKSAWYREQPRSRARSQTEWPKPSSKLSSAITRASPFGPMQQTSCASSIFGSSTTILSIRTRRSATDRRASSESSWWRRRPRTRSALGVDRMKDECPRRRSGQGRQPRPARWRAAPALRPADHGSTSNNTVAPR